MSSPDQIAARLKKTTESNQESKSSSFTSRRASNKKEQTVSAPSMENNPFAKIAAETADPKVQKQRMVELLTYVDAETTEQNKKYLSEYNAYMQSERQRLAVELIKMTDTETFANMQRVLTEINDGVLDFEEKIKPFMEIINAVRLIQEEDATTDILSEMREDQKARDALEVKLRGIREKIQAERNLIKDKEVEASLKSKERTWLGYGGIKASAKKRIAILTVEIDESKATIQKLEAELKEAQSQVIESESKYKHLADAKKIVANMLVLSETEHVERHKDLVDTAASFVQNTKSRVDDTLGHSVKMDAQLKSLSDLAFGMRARYKTLSEATKEAESINSEIHAKVKAEIDSMDIDDLDRITKEGENRNISKHISSLNDITRETVDVLSDLTISSQRIETMETANTAQIKKTEQIQTSGIAGVADNLSSVLTAINQAAIGQASTAAQQSLRRMNDTTMELTKESMVNSAVARKEDNQALVNALEQFANFGEIISLTNDAALETIKESRKLVSDYKELADDVNHAAQRSLEVTSDAITEQLEDEKSQ